MPPPGSNGHGSNVAGPAPISRLQVLELKLRSEWKLNRAVLKHIAAVTKMKYGRVMDAKLEIEADWKAGLEWVDWDSPGAPDRSRMNYEAYKRRTAELEALERSDPSGDATRVAIAEQIAAQKKTVADLESRAAFLKAQLSRLAETDARTEIEKAGGEPPHPPYARMGAVNTELRRVEEDLAVEKKLLRAREQDAAVYDLKKQQQKDQDAARKKRPWKF